MYYPFIMDVSIILVSYNTKDLTRNCLKSVYEKTQGISYEIWVVDNASTDGSVEMIKEEFPEVKLIENKENLGFGTANNLAIKQSQSKYCFLLNTDTILLNNAVKILFDFMEKPENSNVGACGGQLFNSDMTYQPSWGNFKTLENLQKKAYGTNYYEIKHRLNKFLSNFKDKEKVVDYNKGNSITKVDYISGADLMLRRSVLEECGIFDERFFMYSEEVELQFRIQKHNYSCVFVPEAKIMHYGGASIIKENTPLNVEKIALASTILFFKLAYGDKAAKKAKLYYIIYYFRYLFVRFFSPKAFARLKMAFELQY